MKCAKGTQDFTPEQMVVRNRIYEIISKNYSRFGARQIETPLLELTETLQKKYGDDGQKTLFDVKPVDAECLSLRYDLTVPLCRYCLQYGVVKERFYQIGNSFRVDTPNIERGRRRQFVQADIDIVGEEKSLVLDVQLIKLGIDTLIDLGIPQSSIIVKVNNRELLAKNLIAKGIKEDQILTVCSSLDKSDKISADDMLKELQSKGIDTSIAELIITSTDGTDEQVEWGGLLTEYAEALGIGDRVEIDFKLARGMDYYTDIIYEFFIAGTSCGAVGAGGRYDNLTLQMGSTVKIPMIGLSLGVERIFKYLSSNTLTAAAAAAPVGTYIARITKEGTDDTALSLYQLRVYNKLLRSAASSARVISSTAQKSISKQLQYAIDNGYEFLVTVGNREMLDSTFTVKNLTTKTVEMQSI